MKIILSNKCNNIIIYIILDIIRYIVPKILDQQITVKKFLIQINIVCAAKLFFIVILFHLITYVACIVALCIGC